MAGNFGIAALMGLLGGAGKGANEGYGAAIADEQKAAALAEQKRQFDESKVTDLSMLPPALRTQLGLGDVGKVPTSIVPTLGTMAEKNMARDTAASNLARERSTLSTALDQAATDYGTPAAINRSGAMAEPEAAGTPAPVAPAQPHAGFKALQRMVPGMEPKNLVTPFTELLKEQGPTGANAGANHETRDMEGRQIRFTYDRAGNVTNRVDLGPSREGIGPFQRSDIEGLLVERGWIKDEPGWREAYANVARQVPVGGVGIYGAGQLVIPPPPRGAKAPAAPATSATPREGLGAAPLVTAQQALSAGDTANLADFRTLRERLDRVEKAYNPDYVGPIAGRLGALRTATGYQATTEEANLRAEITSVQNWIVYLKSGKQISIEEFNRLKQEMPDINNPDVVFRARLERVKNLMDEMLASREREYSARGFRGGSPAPRPAAPAAPAAPAKPQYEEGARMFSPSRQRWYVIQNGQPVAE